MRWRLAAYARPGGVVFCHREAHVIVDEPGSAELFGGGCADRPRRRGGEFAPATLDRAIARCPEGNTHIGRPVAVSLTELTELGTAYRPDEIAAIAEVAKQSRDRRAHGRRALRQRGRGLGAAPADLTWSAGVDVMSFGGTKNGCLARRGGVFFDPGRGRRFRA